jgi:hypothetical protein
MTAPSNPIAAAFALTPWWMLAIRDFDAIALHPCCIVGLDDGRDIVAVCEEPAEFWSVYGHRPDGRWECFEDFATKTEAEAFATRLRDTYPHLAEEVSP